MCRAKTSRDNEKGGSCPCGLAFPTQMWCQPTERWRFTCNVEWKNLAKEAEKYPDDEILNGWVNALVRKYGEDLGNWPRVGCGSNFLPWKRGASMVIGLKHQDATWTAFLSERFPHALDMEIREHRAEFYMEAAKLTPEQLLEVLPAGFPMTSLFEEFPGITRFPISKWEEAGEPVMTVKNWCNLCMMVASGNLTTLGSIFETASKIIEEEEATAKFVTPSSSS